MDDSYMVVEIYEWKEGETRPGSDRKPREDCLDFYEIPQGGPVPLPGDVIFIPDYEKKESFEWPPKRYRVLEREHLLGPRKPPKDSQSPLSYSKMWIHVREIGDDYVTKTPAWTNDKK